MKVIPFESIVNGSEMEARSCCAFLIGHKLFVVKITDGRFNLIEEQSFQQICFLLRYRAEGLVPDW